MNKNSKDQILFPNVLKFLASIAVVMIHVSGTYWYNPPESINWNILNVYDSLCRWCVPIFIMITGMFLLDEEKKLTIKSIYKKYITKIVIIFIFWSFIYALYCEYNNNLEFNISRFIYSIITGHYHLWYLYMLIGLYIHTPIIKLVTKQENKNIIEYYLIIWFIFCCVLGTLVKLPYLEKYSVILENINFVLGYTGYYILGYYLNKYKISRKKENVFCFLGIISLVFIILSTAYIKMYNNIIPSELFYNYLSFPVCFLSISVFIFAKRFIIEKKVNSKISLFFKKYTKIFFGIYLIHPLILYIFENIIYDVLCFNQIIGIPLITILVYILSFIISYTISKIPIINKYII